MKFITFKAYQNKSNGQNVINIGSKQLKKSKIILPKEFKIPTEEFKKWI